MQLRRIWILASAFIVGNIFCLAIGIIDPKIFTYELCQLLGFVSLLSIMWKKS